MRLLPAFLLALAFLLAGCQGKESDAPGHPTETGHQHTPGMTHSPETPTEGGQTGFAAIQEIVATLEDDPTTDWSKVNITALRQHLQDMDQLTLALEVEEHAVPGGISVNIPTSSPGYEAALRMVPQHVALLAMPTWSTNVTISSAGVLLTITAAGHEVDHIRALGFFGVMATQSHHQEHHLMLALGQPMH